MMELPKEFADGLKEKLWNATESEDIVAVWNQVGLELREDDARDFIESCHFEADDRYKILTRFSKEEREWIAIMNQTTNAQELFDLSRKLQMPLTPQEAEIIAEKHQYMIENRKEPQEKRNHGALLEELYAEMDRRKQEMILQKIYAWTLTPEDLAKFFPPD